MLKAKITADLCAAVHTQLALVPMGEQSPSGGRQWGPYPDSGLSVQLQPLAGCDDLEIGCEWGGQCGGPGSPPPRQQHESRARMDRTGLQSEGAGVWDLFCLSSRHVTSIWTLFHSCRGVEGKREHSMTGSSSAYSPSAHWCFSGVMHMNCVPFADCHH